VCRWRVCHTDDREVWLRTTDEIECGMEVGCSWDEERSRTLDVRGSCCEKGLFGNK
jgi:hypothetical protein